MLYIVGCPTRGVQFYEVEAGSKAEARRKVGERAGVFCDEVEYVFFEVVWEGVPGVVIADVVRRGA